MTPLLASLAFQITACAVIFMGVVQPARRRVDIWMAKTAETERESRFRLLHDALTGLPNAAYLHAHLTQIAAGADRAAGQTAVLRVDLDRRENRLRDALKAFDRDYDFVLIDCPPSLSMLTLNGLCAAHGVIIPMQCEYYALEGLSDLVNTIKKVHANLNRELKIIGLLRVMFDPRMTLQQQVSAQLESHFGDKVFKTVVPRNVRLAEAPSYGMPGVVYDRASRGAQAYISFGAEMIERVRKDLN